jgi:hypothetical protein
MVAKPPQRIPVRRRESEVTTAAWQLDVSCDQGRGNIVLVDVSEQASCFRGDGIFLGWSQVRLAEIYQTLTESLAGSDADPPLLQLG